MTGWPVYQSYPQRVRNLAFHKTHAEWANRTRGGRYKQTADDYRKDNQAVGSSFNPAIVDQACCKANNGHMHTGKGHQDHFWKSCGSAIEKRMQGCEWQRRLDRVEEDVRERNSEISRRREEILEDPEIVKIKSEIRSLRQRIRVAEDDNERARLEDKLRLWKEEERDYSEDGELGDLTLIEAGMEEFETIVREGNQKDSKRPKSDLQFVLWKAIESRAGGRLDPKQSGMDQTNASGMESVKNCGRVFDALLGMYPQGDEVHEWLSVEVPKWRRLGRAIYDVACFLKSQRKRTPAVCDLLLFRLWCCWEDAFPGKSFNKYHGLFCTVREYVWVFEMTGRVSEESNEAYNAKLEEIKKVLQCMVIHKQRVRKWNERSQVNLKGEVVGHKKEIVNKIKGNKRGPYGARKRTFDDREVLSGAGSIRVVNGERFFVLASGKLLPEDWKDIYDWFWGGRAPKDWYDRFADTAPISFSAVDGAKEMHSKLL